MASAICNDLRFFLKPKKISSFWCQSARHYSVFPPNFKEPIVDRQKIKEILKAQPIEELELIQVKPAYNGQSCSVFYHEDVELLIQEVMRHGKRELAKDLVRNSFTKIKHIQRHKLKLESDEEKRQNILLSPLEVFEQALKNVSPLLWFQKIKKSGSWYKIPVGITEEKAKKRGIKWLVESARTKGTKVSFHIELANELIDASQYKGKSINKKLELHKMCEANRGYAHYWWT